MLLSTPSPFYIYFKTCLIAVTLCTMYDQLTMLFSFVFLGSDLHIARPHSVVLHICSTSRRPSRLTLNALMVLKRQPAPHTDRGVQSSGTTLDVATQLSGMSPQYESSLY